MLENIRQNFERLIALYESKKQESDSLRTELEAVKAENDALNRQISELKKEIDNLRLTDAFMVPAGGDGGAEEKIGRLIKEIDKCIALLEK